jgi:hypothetical protein
LGLWGRWLLVTEAELFAALAICSLLFFDEGHFLESELQVGCFGLGFFGSFFVWWDALIKEIIELLVFFKGFSLFLGIDNLLLFLKVLIVLQSELTIFLFSFEHLLL